FKVDRMSMAHSLEVRVPLLDNQLLEWVLRLPWAMRFRRGRGKHLLRRVAARYLPASIVKPRKQGFTVPVGRWPHGGLGRLGRGPSPSRVDPGHNAAGKAELNHRMGRTAVAAPPRTSG